MLIPYNRPHLKQMHEEHKRSVSPQIPVHERQRELGQNRRNQHECNSQPHPHDVVGLLVNAAEHRGAYELRAVQDGGPQHAEGWMDFTVVDHHHDAVLTRVRGGLLRHHLRDVMLGRRVVFHRLTLLIALFIWLDPRSVHAIVYEKSSSVILISDQPFAWCMLLCELGSYAHCHICGSVKDSHISI